MTRPATAGWQRLFKFVLVILLVLVIDACAQFPAVNVEPNADDNLFRKNPDLWWTTQKFPQDNHLHFGGSIDRLHDKSGAAIGWQFGISMKCAWPIVVIRNQQSAISNPAPSIKRPPYPARALSATRRRRSDARRLRSLQIDSRLAKREPIARNSMTNKARTFGPGRARHSVRAIPTIFQRPDAITQPLDVIVTVFNSARYRTRWKHYEDFISMAEAAGSAVRIWTVEIAFGAREFALTDPRNERHLQLRTSSELWHKERSQNLLVQRVIARHPHAEYFAFIDADVSFLRHDWADEARHALQHYDVVQMWEEAYDLDQSGRIIHKHQSFASCYKNGAPVPSDNDYYYPSAGKGIVYWHPGYAWAWRRSALEGVGGLIDWAILGSADFHMAHAIVGTVHQTLKRKLGHRYARAMREWQARALASIKKNIGCMPGSMVHHWHGPKLARRYKSRWKILEQTQFDQFRDLVADMQGLYRLQHHGTQRSNLLRDLIRQYFHERNEDASQ